MGELYLSDTCHIEWNNAAHLTHKIVKTTSLDQPDLNKVILLVNPSLKKAEDRSSLR